MIGFVILFLLAVLFVAAVWGREAAQKMFRGGVKTATVLFGLAAIGIILLAINLEQPNQMEMQRTLDASRKSAYYVPIDGGNTNDAGASLRRPAAADPPPTSTIGSYDIATDDYLTGRSTAADAPALTNPAQPATTRNIAAPLPTALPRTGKPHFGFGYRPSNGFIVVTQVYPGSPAAEAGITPGMGILGIDKKSVHRLDDVWNAQHRNHQIGDIVTFTVGDAAGSGTYNIPIRLGSDAEPWGASVQR